MSLTRILSILLVLATAAVYFQVYQFDYLNWDDNAYVVMNPAIEGFTEQNVAWAFRNEHVYNFHPLTWMSYMLDVQLFGRSPAVFHVVNVVIHTANVLLLFALMRALTGSVLRSAFVAAVFAVHPLHVESVAWISERKDVLTTLFGILCLLAYVRYVRAPRRRWFWYFLTVLAFALALLAKQTLVTLPFVMLLLDWWPLRRTADVPSDDNPEEEVAGTTWLQLVIEKIPLFVLTIVFCVIVIVVQKPGVEVAEYAIFAPWVRIANALLAYGLYLKKAVWPFEDLAAFYPHPGEGISLQAAAVAGILLLAITVLCVANRRKHPYLMIGWFWFLGTLVPMIGLVQVGEQQMADRNMYFPLIGLAIMVAWLVPDLLPEGRFKSRLLPTAAVVVISVFGLAAFVQATYWQDGVSLFEHTLRLTRNNYVAHNALGGAMQSQGFVMQGQAIATQSEELAQDSQVTLNEAAAQYERALKLNPDYAEAYLNLANLKRDRGDLAGADALYRTALKLQPDDPQTQTDYGEMLLAQNRVDEALPLLEQAVKTAQYFPEAHNHLGRALAAKGDTKRALAEFALALMINPLLVDAEYNLAYVLIQSNRLEEALAHLDEVMSNDPTHPLARPLAVESYIQSGRILAESGNDVEAVKRFERALALVTNENEAFVVHLLTGTSLASIDPVAAETHFAEAVQLQPQSLDARLAFGRMLLDTGQRQAALDQLQEAARLNPNDQAVQAALREAEQPAPAEQSEK